MDGIKLKAKPADYASFVERLDAPAKDNPKLKEQMEKARDSKWASILQDAEKS